MWPKQKIIKERLSSIMQKGTFEEDTEAEVYVRNIYAIAGSALC